MAKMNFDATKVAPSQPLEPLPSGWYPVAITSSEIKPTKDGTGTRLELVHQVMQGHGAAGRKIYDGLNIENKNAVAQQIAQEQLSAICHAIGIVHVKDTNQLHGKPFLIKLAIRSETTDPKSGKVYEARNEVKGYAAQGTQEVIDYTPPSRTAAPGVGGKAPAWAKGGAAEQEEEEKPKGKAPAKKAATKKAPAKSDLIILGESADEGDEMAQTKLGAKAKKAKLDPDEYPTWLELAEELERLANPPVEEEEEEEEEEQEEEEEDGDTPPWAKG